MNAARFFLFIYLFFFPSHPTLLGRQSPPYPIGKGKYSYSVFAISCSFGNFGCGCGLF